VVEFSYCHAGWCNKWRMSAILSGLDFSVRCSLDANFKTYFTHIGTWERENDFQAWKLSYWRGRWPWLNDV
jgi:hypothetical protein